MLGYTVEELQKFKWQDITPKEEVEHIQKLIEPLVGGSKNTVRFEKRYICKDGSRVWADVNTTIQRNESGEPDFFITAIVNITEKRKAEQNLKEVNRVLKETGKFAKVGGWEFDIKTGEGTWTEEVARIHDLPPNMPTNKNIGLKYYTPNSKSIIEKALNQAIEQRQSYDLDLEMISEKGVHKWVRTIGTPVVENGKVVKLRGSFQDITERKIAELQLLDERNRISRIADAVPGLIYSFYMNPGEQFEIQYASPAAIEIFGYTPGELLNDVSLIFNRIHPEDVDLVNQSIFESAKSKQNWCSEFRYNHPSKGEIWLEGHSVPGKHKGGILWHGYVSDITTRKKTEKEKDDAYHKFQALVEQSLAGIYIFSQDKFLFVNKKFADMFGYTVSDVLSKLKPTDVVKPRERATANRNINDRFNSKVESVHYITEGLHKSGRVLWIEIHGTHITLDGEDVITGTVLDITEKHSANQILQESERKFRTLFEQASVGVGIIETSTGKYVSANDKQCKILGYSHEETLQLNYMSITHPDDLLVDLNNIEKLKRGEIDKFRMEKRYIHKNGNIVWVVLNVYPLWAKGEQSNFHVAICEDISEIKLAEKELKEKTHLLSESQRIAHIGSYTWDIKTGEIQWSNECYRLYGVSRETFTVTAESGITCIHPEDQAKAQEWVEALIKGEEAYPITYRTVWSDGSEHLLVTDGEVFRDEKGEPLKMIGTIQDITEQEKKNRIIAESEQRYRSLFENMNAGFVLFEMVQNKKGKTIDLIIAAANSGFEKTTGLDLRSAQGKHLTKVLPGIEKDEADWIGNYSEIARTGISKQFENYSKLLDTYYSVSAFKAGPNLCAVTFTDVTAAKKAELKLKESEARFREIYEQSPLAIQYYDSLGNLIDVNQATLNLFGISDKATIQPYNFWHTSKLSSKDAETLKSGKPVMISSITDFDLIKEYKLFKTNKSGKIFVTMYVAPILSSDTTVNYLVHLVDVTERHTAELEIMKLNESLEEKVKIRTSQLEMANKELEAFTYSASHDLRAPLRAINGYSKFLVEDFGQILDKEGNRLINIIRESVARMDQLISDLLRLSRINKNPIYTSTVNMNDLVCEVVEETVSEAVKKAFVIEVQNLPDVAGDENLLRQVWVNLISNALKYSGPSKIKKVNITFIEDRDDYVFSVKDYGVGFDSQYKEKLFGVFQRLHRMEEFEGTGIGLAIVQRIIHRHRGRVWAEGEVGKGAKFYFSLPKFYNNEEKFD